jgi:16S rRNA (cytosine967-C5)-methyltransferase
MLYIKEHIRTILKSYQGEVPLALFLKDYFRKYPKLGSRDRKLLSQMAYSWYRCSKGFGEETDLFSMVVHSLLLTETNPAVNIILPEEWHEKENLTLEEKLEQLEEQDVSFDLEDLAPFPFELSEGISSEEWLGTMLTQPRLFIRAQTDPGQLLEIFAEQDIDYELIGKHCISLANGTAVDKILPPERYWVQDASSQATGNYFKPLAGEKWWDSCAGAGGKSLMLKSIQPDVELTVSDKRESILRNLSERFRLYFGKQPERIIADLSDASALAAKLKGRSFDNIICDAPCTGSGTWARTPEQLYFFKEELIEEYAERQRLIAGNVLPYLKPGGRLIYITCSVFKAENEDVVAHLLAHSDMELTEQKLINGTTMRADSMFVAVLRKPA